MLGSLYSKSLIAFSILSMAALAEVNIATPPKGEVSSEKPFFTGPLLTTSAIVITKDHGNIEPYLYVMNNYGAYDKNWDAHDTMDFNQYIVSVPIQVGINDYLDIEMIPSVSENRSGGASDLGIGDFGVGFELQLIQEEKFGIPVKLAVIETLPTGSYENLSPRKNGTDVHGGGAFVTNLTLAASKSFHIKGIHYLRTRVNFIYSFAPPVHVKGLNAYGGSEDTNGKVKPGNDFQVLFGLEYSFTQKVAFACDFYFITSEKNSFVESAGNVVRPVTPGGPSSEQFSIAPALEYNFTENVGIIGGAWFSLFGRNSSQFAGGVIALNWYI